MADLLRRGADWLHRQRHAHMAREVEYRRGEHAATLDATVGATAFEQESQSGVIERTESRDYLVRTADLSLPTLGAVLPVEGDQIVETIGEVDQVFEVMAFGAEPPFRFSDPGQTTLRIHTRRIGAL